MKKIDPPRTVNDMIAVHKIMDSIFHQNNKSLRASYIQGLFACAMVGFSQEYFTPFLLFLGGSAQLVGLLNALNNLFSSVIQLGSAELTDRTQSRKKVTMLFVFMQAIMLILIIALTGLTSWPQTPSIFIASVVLFSSFGSLTSPCWLSLLSDLIPPNKRGEYFGWRGRHLGFVTVGSTFLAGFILDRMDLMNAAIGFSVIFGIAFFSRLLSFYYIHKIEEPPLVYKKEDYFTLFQFFARFKESNFLKFVFFAASMNFSVNLAAPFFAVFMLKDLHFNYLLFTIINIAAPLALYTTIARWGKHADYVGNLKIMKVAAPLIGFVPLFWILNQSPLFLIGVEMFSGFLWAGFNLCSANFIIDAVQPQKRTRCIGYFTLVNGLALAGGSIVGSLILPLLSPLSGYKILTLFLISSVLRIGFGLFMPLFIQEVRGNVQSVRNHALLFSLIGIKPIYGIERKTLEI